jgi:hypothetical protein
MCELLSIAFEGIHPTFKHVPPRDPRFSIHAVWGRTNPQIKKKAEDKGRTHLETELSGLNGSHVSTRSCHENAQISVLDIMPARTSTNNNSII